MKIDFISSIPCTVFYKGRQKVTPFSIFSESECVIQLSILPVSPEKYQSYTLIIEIKNDTVHSLSGGAKATCWGNGACIITLFPPITQIKFTPQILAQKKVNHDLITLYDDGTKKVMCEGSSFYTFDLPDGITSLTMKAQDVRDGAILCIEGKVCEKDYLLALYSNGTEWKIMHNLLADKISSTESGIKTVDLLPTMLRFERRAFYKAFSTTPEHTEFIPTVRHTYPDELIPYLFFESVFLGDDNAVNYLSDSLSHDLSALKEFIGDVDSVCFPEFGDYSLDVIALFNSEDKISHPDLYKIQVEKGKITNIIHLLTCN